MDEYVVDVNAQLQLCKEQHELDTFEIAQLQAKFFEIQPKIDALNSAGGDGGRLHSDYKQLKKVFYAHLKWAESGNEPSKCLLLFYAVECGLKCVYLRRSNLRSTKQLATNGLLSLNGHDLQKWCKALNMSHLLSGTTIHFSVLSDASKKQYNIDRAHEAWRYGVSLESEAQTSIVQWLFRLSDWIKKQREIM
jgi:hypothetical protein